MRIPLPRQAEWLTRNLDRYSDWADKETGVVLRIGRYRYKWLNMDGVTVLMGIVFTATMCWWYGWFYGLVVGTLSFLAGLVLFELGFWGKREPSSAADRRPHQKSTEFTNTGDG
jgi:hypothetical protein